MRRLGLVTQVAPLRVQLNGDTADAPAVAMHDFSTAVVGETEVVVETLELRWFAWHANPGLGGAASIEALNDEIDRALAAEGVLGVRVGVLEASGGVRFASLLKLGVD